MIDCIRWMIRRDYPLCASIASSTLDPWDEGDLIRVLRERAVIGMVAEDRGQVVGWMVYELHRSRFHLLNLAVSLWRRREGIGSAMLTKLAGKLAYRRTEITVDVRERALPAQLFLRANGFKATEVARRYFSDTREDAYRFRYERSGLLAPAGVPVRREGGAV